ncbi:MAG: hypothetical protein JXK07_07275 [Spirochaetes bacterium]|nr:hypothetical protein [Spirochaetota bacterium]MBN2769655.1 hypothetical protein [Spirochaetota bacterium]HRX14972.1 hypothetical protein [Spirochaetota bacterium]
MEWEKLLRNSVKDGTIRELYLRKIPVLKNCDNWNKIEPIGYIDTPMKYTHYKGILVMYQDRIFFVTSKTMEALSEFVKWNIRNKIRVIPEKK